MTLFTKAKPLFEQNAYGTAVCHSVQGNFQKLCRTVLPRMMIVQGREQLPARHSGK
jgi:hypothetical protein